MSPTALYIRRAELHHTKEYISKALEFNMYGIVKDIQFVAKTSGTVAYNGVIVIFNSVFLNARVISMCNDLTDTVDKTSKIYHDFTGKYWIVNEHKQQELLELEDEDDVDNIIETIPHDTKVDTLTTMLKSSAVQMHYLHKSIQRNERQLMEQSNDETHSFLCNAELRDQIEEHIQDKKQLKKQLKEQDEDNRQLNEELVQCRTMVACLQIQHSIDLKDTKLELDDATQIISYMSTLLQSIMAEKEELYTTITTFKTNCSVQPFAKQDIQQKYPINTVGCFI
jgi:hypothetical protein